MTILSAIFFFLSQHPILSLPLLILAGLALGGISSRLFKRGGWVLLGSIGFVAGMANVFTGSMINGIFVNAYGVYGSAVITHEEETNSDLNDRPIWYYEAVVRTADGQDVSPIARMIVPTPRSRTVDSAIASTRDGSTRKKSVIRISVADTQRP